MIAHQAALLKREVWEHRSIWLTPVVLALVIAVAVLTGAMSLSTYAEEVDVGLIGAQNAEAHYRRAILYAPMLVIVAIFAVGAGIVQIFYSLDSLYSERKDKSILFWRSLPVTDAETVISKVLTATVIIPAVALAGTFVTHLTAMILSSGWVMFEGGNALHLIWQSAPVFDVWAWSIITAYLVTIWLSPFLGWFFFVSAFTKRTPMLLGFLPLVVLPLLEKAILPTNFLGHAISERFTRMPLSGVDFEEVFDDNFIEAHEHPVSIMSVLDIGRFFSSASVWAGVVVCGLFITAAIYVRRYKDDS